MSRLGLDDAPDPAPAGDIIEPVLAEILAIRKKKMADYSRPYTDAAGHGLSNLEKQGWEGVVVRMQDKMDRLNGFALQSIIERQTGPANESVEDAFLDMATYAALGLILFRWEVSWRKDP